MTTEPGLASWLRLTLTPGLGPVAIRLLLKQYGLPEQVLARPRSELLRFAPRAAIDATDSAEVTAAVAAANTWAAQPGHAVVTLADEAYPKPLLEIADPPTLLYAHGRLELLARPALAVVGSRNATAQEIGRAHV